jgi:small neutral amino acid transporter SnatA (MarC family)
MNNGQEKICIVPLTTTFTVGVTIIADFITFANDTMDNQAH